MRPSTRLWKSILPPATSSHREQCAICSNRALITRLFSLGLQCRNHPGRKSGNYSAPQRTQYPPEGFLWCVSSEPHPGRNNRQRNFLERPQGDFAKKDVAATIGEAGFHSWCNPGRCNHASALGALRTRQLLHPPIYIWRCYGIGSQYAFIALSQPSLSKNASSCGHIQVNGWHLDFRTFATACSLAGKTAFELQCLGGRILNSLFNAILARKRYLKYFHFLPVVRLYCVILGR